MQFTNDFIVPAALDEAWTLLTDVPRIAPCLPGATVQPGDNGEYAGAVTVKVGPIKVSYQGTAHFRELDSTNHRMVLDAQGKEDSGKGAAGAIVTVELHSAGPDKTEVRVRTELQVTGKVAQFGRNAMADIGTRLIGQFATNLETLLSADGATHTAETTTRKAPVQPQAQDDAGLDALSLLIPVAKRYAPTVAAFLLGAILTALISRLRGPRAAARRVEPS
ncbi:SRPBCC family protein [Saccharopolyspora sp. NPDC003752]